MFFKDPVAKKKPYPAHRKFQHYQLKALLGMCNERIKAISHCTLKPGQYEPAAQQLEEIFEEIQLRLD